MKHTCAVGGLVVLASAVASDFQQGNVWTAGADLARSRAVL